MLGDIDALAALRVGEDAGPAAVGGGRLEALECLGSGLALLSAAVPARSWLSPP